MARSRNIKPGFFRNEELAECNPFARLAFIGLWTEADREGRLEDRPRRLKGALFPFYSVEMEPLLQQLEQRGFISRYEAGDRRVIQILNFAKHQNPHHRETPSVLPPMLAIKKVAEVPEASGSLDKAEALGENQASLRLSSSRSALQNSLSRAESLYSDSLQTDSIRGNSLPIVLAEGSRGGALNQPKKSAPSKLRKPGRTLSTWQAYADAFLRRHGASPIQSAAVNGQLAKFVDQVGEEDAPKVAAFYVTSNETFYVMHVHPVNLLLRDAQKLRTLWATGRASPASNQAKRLHSGFAGLDYQQGVGPNGEVL